MVNFNTGSEYHPLPTWWGHRVAGDWPIYFQFLRLCEPHMRSHHTSKLSFLLFYFSPTFLSLYREREGRNNKKDHSKLHPKEDNVMNIRIVGSTYCPSKPAFMMKMNAFIQQFFYESMCHVLTSAFCS